MYLSIHIKYVGVITDGSTWKSNSETLRTARNQCLRGTIARGTVEPDLLTYLIVFQPSELLSSTVHRRLFIFTVTQSFSGLLQAIHFHCRWVIFGRSRCSISGRSGGAIFFSRVNFLCWLLLRYPFHPRVTAEARKRTLSFCKKCRWKATAKFGYTLIQQSLSGLIMLSNHCMETH